MVSVLKDAVRRFSSEIAYQSIARVSTLIGLHARKSSKKPDKIERITNIF